MHGRETTTLWCYTFIASLQETNDSLWWLVLASEFPTQEMGRPGVLINARCWAVLLTPGELCLGLYSVARQCLDDPTILGGLGTACLLLGR